MRRIHSARTFERRDEKVDTKTGSWWQRNSKAFLYPSVVILASISFVWLGYEFWRLICQPTHLGTYMVHPGAIDLKLRHVEVHHWFSGKFVYDSVDAVYPPASYLFLWPFLGWIALKPAILLWALTSVAALGWLIHLVVKNSKTNNRIERLLVSLLPMSMYATGATIGNGQLTVHIMAFLLGGLLLIDKKPATLMNDIVGSLLILFALAKPSISAPFFWIILFAPGRLRPALFMVSGYVLATFIAASFQESSPLVIINAWLDNSLEISTKTSSDGSYSNMHVLIDDLRLTSWKNTLSFFTLMALGLWIFLCRRKDLWILIGVTALIARFWSYHRWYDDLLILLPMVSLVRIVKTNSSFGKQNIWAGLLLILTILTVLAPGGLYLFPSPWKEVYIHLQTVVWISILVFLVSHARRKRCLNEERK